MTQIRKLNDDFVYAEPHVIFKFFTINERSGAFQ